MKRQLIKFAWRISKETLKHAISMWFPADYTYKWTRYFLMNVMKISFCFYHFIVYCFTSELSLLLWQIILISIPSSYMRKSLALPPAGNAASASSTTCWCSFSAQCCQHQLWQSGAVGCDGRYCRMGSHHPGADSVFRWGSTARLQLQISLLSGIFLIFLSEGLACNQNNSVCHGLWHSVSWFCENSMILVLSSFCRCWFWYVSYLHKITWVKNNRYFFF